jgi:hypothetical protein
MSATNGHKWTRTTDPYDVNNSRCAASVMTRRSGS